MKKKNGLNPDLDVFGPNIPIWELGQEGGRTRPIDQEILYKNLCDFVDVLNKYNIKYCISHGTMLGLYRDSQFIPWDDDIDISLLDMSQRMTVAVDCREELESKGFYMPKLGDINKPVQATGPDANMPFYDTVAIRNGEKIEGWWFEEKIHNNQKFYIYDEPRAGWDLKHPAKFYDEPKDFKWKDRIWKIPNHVEEYLVLMYGDNWKYPDRSRKYTNQIFDEKGNIVIQHE